MAVKTSSLVPFPITSMPDRLTPLVVANKTVNTTTAGTGSVTRLNRVQSSSFTFAIPVTEVTEQGAQFRVGGVDELGEVKFKVDFNAVGINNLAALCGIAVNTTPGATTSIGLTQFQNAKIDFIRLVADPQNNVFGTYYFQDCIFEDYTVDIKEKALVQESVSGKGPNGFSFGGFVLPKVYIATGADVTAGYLTLNSLLSVSEGFVQMPQPVAGRPLNYWQQNGANFFPKIEKVPGAVLTASPTRYNETINAAFVSPAAISSTAYITPSVYLPYLKVGSSVTLGLGTANVETVTVTALASTVNTTSVGTVTAGAGVVVTPVSMLGIFPGVSLTAVNANGSNSEVVVVTAVTSTTFTATFATSKAANFLISTPGASFQANVTKTHAALDPINLALAATQNYVGNAVFIPTGSGPSYSGGKLYLGDAFVAGDMFRIVMLSYNTDVTAGNVPTSIPAATPDTVDRAGVNARIVPVAIGVGNLKRAQSCSFNFSYKRDEVQGVGEPTKVYGVPSVPDVKISLDFKETDLSLPSQLLTGSQNLTSQGGTIFNDLVPFEMITRNNLAVAQPAMATLYDPFNPAVVLATYTSQQFVLDSIDFTSSNKGDNMVKVSAMDITGNFTINFVQPM